MDLPRLHRLRRERYRLEGVKCNICGRAYFPPRDICRDCGSSDLAVYRFKGQGIVHSFSEIASLPEGYFGGRPNAIALVELEEGVLVLAQLTDFVPEKVHVGCPVQLVVRRLKAVGEGGPIVYVYKFTCTDGEGITQERHDGNRTEEDGSSKPSYAC